LTQMGTKPWLEFAQNANLRSQILTIWIQLRKAIRAAQSAGMSGKHTE
jgi:hypothetical protein